MNLAEKILSTGTRTLARPITSLTSLGTIVGVEVWQNQPYIKCQDGSMIRVTETGTGPDFIDQEIMAQLPPDLQVNDMLEMTKTDGVWLRGDRLMVMSIWESGEICIKNITGGPARAFPPTDPWFGQYTKWPDDYRRPYWELTGGRKVPVPLQWPTKDLGLDFWADQFEMEAQLRFPGDKNIIRQRAFVHGAGYAAEVARELYQCLERMISEVGDPEAEKLVEKYKFLKP